MMETDSISGIQDEVSAFLATLDNQITGNEDIIKGSVSPDLVAAVQDPPLVEMRDRQSKGEEVLNAIDMLLAAIASFVSDGGTTPLSFTLPDHVLAEYKGKLNDYAAGASVFGIVAPAGMATTFDITLGPAVPKPNPLPPR